MSDFLIFIAYALLPAIDGAMTGAGSAVAPNPGFLLAAAQRPANIPGGFAAANLRRHNGERRRRIPISLFMFAPVRERKNVASGAGGSGGRGRQCLTCVFAALDSPTGEAGARSPRSAKFFTSIRILFWHRGTVSARPCLTGCA